MTTLRFRTTRFVHNNLLSNYFFSNGMSLCLDGTPMRPFFLQFLALTTKWPPLKGKRLSVPKQMTRVPTKTTQALQQQKNKQELVVLSLFRHGHPPKIPGEGQIIYLERNLLISGGVGSFEHDLNGTWIEHRKELSPWPYFTKGKYFMYHSRNKWKVGEELGAMNYCACTSKCSPSRFGSLDFVLSWKVFDEGKLVRVRLILKRSNDRMFCYALWNVRIAKTFCALWWTLSVCRIPF